jgi:hypothetical protein
LFGVENGPFDGAITRPTDALAVGVKIFIELTPSVSYIVRLFRLELFCRKEVAEEET